MSAALSAASQTATATVNVVPTDYWATVVQVVPVLALALVFEARALSRQWSPSIPSWFKVTQTLLWLVPLLCFTYILPVALGGVRGQARPFWLPALSEVVISWSVGALFAGPVLSVLVRASAEQVAWLETLDIRIRYSLLKSRRARRKLRAEYQKGEQDMKRLRHGTDELKRELVHVQRSETASKSLAADLVRRIEEAALGVEDVEARWQRAGRNLAELEDEAERFAIEIRANQRTRREAFARVLSGEPPEHQSS